MTKQQAINRINKLEKLAKNHAAQPNEVESAKKVIAELKKKYSLDATDLAQAAKAEAFDELMGDLDRYVTRHRDQVPSAVFEVFDKIKRETSGKDKAAALEKIVTGIRITSILFGYNNSVRTIKETVTAVLTKHEISI